MACSPAVRGRVVGADGVVWLARCLASAACMLASLELGGNMVGAAGAGELCKALEGNSTLTSLGLRSNGIGAAGAGHLSVALRSHAVLTSLDVADNQIAESRGGPLALAQVRTALHCTVLYCTVLYCTVLCCTVLYCPLLLSACLAFAHAYLLAVAALLTHAHYTAPRPLFVGAGARAQQHPAGAGSGAQWRGRRCGGAAGARRLRQQGAATASTHCVQRDGRAR